jgi:putative ABC transport system permease protein
MENFWLDLRHGIRLLTRNRGFTALAVLMLALAIGGSTSIFSVVYGVLLRPLPYPQPSRIVRLFEVTAQGHHIAFSDPDFEDLHEQDSSFRGLAEFADLGPVPVSGDVQPTLVGVSAVSRDFLGIMGVRPMLGHEFPPSQLHMGGAPMALVSYGFWQQYLGGAGDFSSKHLTIEHRLLSIVGVMPPGFAFPRKTQIWVSREQFWPVNPYRTGHNWAVIGRLKKGVTLSAAQAQATGIANRLKRKYGNGTDMVDAAVVPLQEQMVGNTRPALLILLGAVGLLLLVACANVANLLLAQAAGRQQELAVRVAVGASRRRLAGQFVAETLLLSAAGSLLGLPVTIWGVHALLALEPGRLPRAAEVGVHPAVIGFVCALAAATAVGLGLVTALRASSADIQESLKGGSGTQTGGASSHQLRMLLMGAQVAVTLVLLVGAGLLARSFFRLLAVNPGFRTQHVVTMEFPDVGVDIDPLHPKPGDSATLAQQVQRMSRLLERLRLVPGVEHVGAIDAPPFSGGGSDGNFLVLSGNEKITSMDALGHTMDELRGNHARLGWSIYNVASAGYFRAMGIPLLSGRLFDERDGADAPEVAVINQALAERQWPGQNPLGRVIDFGGMDGDLRPITIVGVVGDVRDRGLAEKPQPTCYVDYRQRPLGIHDWTVMMDTTRPMAAILPSARAIASNLWPNSPAQFSTVEKALSASVGDRRFNLLLLGAFALTALLVALMGVYGVGSYLVSQRTKEIGIRLAVGAQTGDVVRMIAGEGLRVILAGAAVGVAGALALARVLASMLFGVSAADLPTFIGVAGLVVAAGLLACYVPARRAARVDPVTALREQ